MILLLACAQPEPADGSVSIDAAWTTPSTTAGELTVNVSLGWEGAWPVTGVAVAGQPATLTRALGARTATATFALTRSLAASLDAADGSPDGYGTLTIEAWSAKADTETLDLAFSVDPTPSSPVDELVVEAELLTDVTIDAPYVPADGSVRVAVIVTADRWAAGTAVVPTSTSTTPTPASGHLVSVGETSLFEFTTGVTAGGVAAAGAGSLTVGAAAGERTASEVLPVRGAPLFAASSPAELTIADVEATVAFPVRTEGVLAECMATADQSTPVTVAIAGGATLFEAGASSGWAPVTGDAQRAALAVTVPAGLSAEATVTLACRDPYGQTGTLTVDIVEPEPAVE